MDAVELPGAIEPTDWFVVFHTKTDLPWLRWIACGRFKHVSAFAYCPGFKAWLLYDTQVTGVRLMLIGNTAAGKAALIKYTADCVIVQITRRHRPMGIASRFGFYCVPAVKHLLGLRCGALRPDGLYRHVLRNGGVRVDEREQPATSGRPEPRD